MADRIRSQKIGISSYTENELVLDVIGKTNIVGDVNVSGISTLGTVQVSSGIITATTGVVTYYGDGSHLFGVTAFNVVQQDIANQIVYPTLANSIGVSSVGISTTELVFNTYTGNLGIGTTNPKVRLQIDGVLGFGTFQNYAGNTNTNIRIGDETTGANLTSGYDNIFMGVGAGEYNNGTDNNFFGKYAGKGHYGLINSLNLTTSTTIPGEANKIYSNLTATGGSGTGALLYFYRDGSGAISYVTYNNPGYNYQVGDVLTVDGSLVGGTSGVDDVTVTVIDVVNSYGSFNNFFGRYSGYNNTTGYYNNFFGRYSGYSNTTGYYNNFFGNRSGYHNTRGSTNNFLGYRAGYYNTTGYFNNFFGILAGQYNTTGYNNNFFGTYGGYYNTTGSNNIFFGNYNGLSNTASNKIIIGNGDGYNYVFFDSPDITKDNQLAIGLRTDANPSKYWLVGDENFNVGIGTTNPTSKLTVGGDIGNTYTTYGSITSSASTLSPVGIHSVLSSSIYRSVEYFIQATEGSRYQAVKLLSIHDGSTSYNTTYGDIFSNGSIATYDVDISGGNVRLVATASTNANVTYIVNYTANKI